MAEPTHAENLAYIEDQLARYLENPDQAPPDLRALFDQWHRAGNGLNQFRTAPTFQSRRGQRAAQALAPSPPPRATPDRVLQERVDELIRNYRVRGHVIAAFNPLEPPRPTPPELDPAHLGITEADLDRPVSTGNIAGPNSQPLRDLLRRLRNTYCRDIGVQFMHIDELHVRQWLSERMEASENRLHLPRERQLRILGRLTDAIVFEQFLQKKFIGAKTFSLEGAETLIPLLAVALNKASDQGVDDVVIGMAHRGRLNVLANIVGKPAQQIFHEFEDKDPEAYRGGGDVKYHLGEHGWYTSVTHQKVRLSLCFNPSHLEYINPVAIGRVRARQDRRGDDDRRKTMTILIHGDAAMAGEGVVQETLNMSELPAYHVGGTLHVVVNNQIGFTTPPEQGRSSRYCTSIAKMLAVPIFHVNGEDPEAVAQVVRLALDFRDEFRRDAFIDMYCYRRRGHNEMDEPMFTQPLLYKRIEQRESVRDAYLARLLQMGDITQEEADQMVEDRTARLEEALSEVRKDVYAGRIEGPTGRWAGYHGGLEREAPDPETGIDKTRLIELLEKLTQTPEGFQVNPKVERGLELRRKMAKGQQPLDWAAAEALAFATLATEGHRIRMTGQDSIRGTFSQRHAGLYDTHDGRLHIPLQHLADDQAPVEIANSPLSENGVLGFEYGYSLDYPSALVLWEAQFGDFANAAQVIIDQFIASGGDKWKRLSGITLLLPHGFEGQGPEHSSARLERFLMLAAEDNIQVTYPSTPAQYFHLLRRQTVRPYRAPLVVMTPKSLLRLPAATSSLGDLAQGRFQRVIGDERIAPATGNGKNQIDRVLLCTGKLYYELAKRREELGREDVAIVRLEQLYPLPLDELKAALAPLPDGTRAVWVQEEPSNMGAEPFLRARFCHELLGRLPLQYIARAESPSPATGSHAAHLIEQEQLITHAFAGNDGD